VCIGTLLTGQGKDGVGFSRIVDGKRGSFIGYHHLLLLLF